MAAKNAELSGIQVEFAKMVEKNKKLKEGGLQYRNKRDDLKALVEKKDAEIEKLKKEVKVSSKLVLIFYQRSFGGGTDTGRGR